MNGFEKNREKNWILKSDSVTDRKKQISAISEELKINPVIARLLYVRGYTSVADAKAFMYMETEMLSDPFLMRDIDKAVDRIKRAIDANEQIVVYGDYDVDGVTAVCALYLYLKSVGASVSYYIPNRVGEGYGVSKSAIDTIEQLNDTDLIITVDTGITAIDEVEYARSLGIDFVITDHHECRSELPNAVAVVNPHRPDCDSPFKELAGVGVVFKLLCALQSSIYGLSLEKATRDIFKNYADLVAIGTIADVMPIKGENRLIVKYGLEMIEKSPRTGIAALIDASLSRSESNKYNSKRRKITSSYIGYTLAPRINAAGRIKTADMAVELLLADKTEAENIAEALCLANKERQNEENKIMKEAYLKIDEADIENNPVIVLDADNWHHGVIGIVSSRITEKYSRPSILVSFEGNDPNKISPSDVGKGSGRSVKGMNLVDALCYCQDNLVKFGGHELAAGLSVTRGELDNFRKKINQYAKSNLSKMDIVPTVEADTVINFEDISLSLAEDLQRLEPYGAGNPVPVFVMRGVTVNEISGVSDAKHTKLFIGDGLHRSLTCMYFSASPSSLGIHVGDRIDLLFNIDLNEWGGRESVQLIVRDLKISKSEIDRRKNERVRFEQIKNGAPFTEQENIMPSRDDFAQVYKLMLNSQRMGVDTLTHRDITSHFCKSSDGTVIGYAKLKIIIMVMKELNIVSISEVADEVYKFKIHYTTSKTGLDKSTLLRKLRAQLERSR